MAGVSPVKILITGAEGQLGRALVRLEPRGVCMLPVDSHMCNVADSDQVAACILNVNPDVVIHCAAYTAVDLAEKEKSQCWKVNVEGTKNVMESCRKIGAGVMLLSTDYVFGDGEDHPHETGDERHALNQYGRSKIAAEDLIQQLDQYFIVRTSWMFGDGINFVKRICQLGRANQEVQVVSDQIGSPTYTQDLAALLVELAVSRRYGIYHATNEGCCSWADLAEESFRLMNIPARVRRISSNEYQSLARRPYNSRLSKKSLDVAGLNRLPSWQDALRRYIEEYGITI